MIDKPNEIVSFEEHQIPALNSMLDAIFNKALSIKSSSVLPTEDTVAEGEIVVYDDGAGTKRLYIKTAKKNLGYVNLT